MRLFGKLADVRFEIRFDDSSAILAAAIKIDVERLKNPPRGQSALFVLDK
jgi:hypothetical protein